MLPTKLRFIWPSGFREDFKKIGQSETRIAMFVNGSGQNEQSLERTFHRCFLPSFTSFGWGVSEEKIKMWKVNRRQTMDNRRWTPSDGKSSHCQLAQWFQRRRLKCKRLLMTLTTRTRDEWWYYLRVMWAKNVKFKIKSEMCKWSINEMTIR